MNNLVELVEAWSLNKGLDVADSSKQFLKVTEEVGEVAAALARNDDVQTFMTWQLEKRGGYAKAIRFALDLIDQLDEPEITEEQAWRVIAGTHNQDEAYWLDAKNRYINSISESELPEDEAMKLIEGWKG